MVATERACEEAIERLRYGMPPLGAAIEFTVGRGRQIEQLVQALSSPETGALLVYGNYGAGKTHLLQVVQEEALNHGFVVAFIAANADGGVRFDKMDTVLGAVCSQIRVPGTEEKGVGALFSAFRRAPGRPKLGDLSDELWSPSVFLALRAWYFTINDPDYREFVPAFIRDWLEFRSTKRRRELYKVLVSGLGHVFQDRRQVTDSTFSFKDNEYRQSWAALRDFDVLSRCSGFRGFVLLVDEFEDVIYSRITQKIEAFRNLGRFFEGRYSLGRSYFAVTPDMSKAFSDELQQRRREYDVDVRQFEALPCFRLTPIHHADMLTLAKKIRDTHSCAYNWNAEEMVGDDELERHCVEVMRPDRPDRVRLAVKSVVLLLDTLYDSLDI